MSHDYYSNATNDNYITWGGPEEENTVEVSAPDW